MPDLITPSNVKGRGTLLSAACTRLLGAFLWVLWV